LTEKTGGEGWKGGSARGYNQKDRGTRGRVMLGKKSDEKTTTTEEKDHHRVVKATILKDVVTQMK